MQTRRPLVLVLVLALTAAALVARSGPAAACTLDNAPRVVTYWSTTTPNPGDWRCDWYRSPVCRLQGWLIAPPVAPSDGGLPAVMFLHGSGYSHGTNYVCEMANYLNAEGYVVFMPLMRGVDDVSPASYPGHGFRNTGINVLDWAAARATTDHPVSYWTMIYMKDHMMHDVRAALQTLVAARSGDGTRALVNPDRIALMGHSYGGALTVLAASAGLSPRPAAAIDLSGAAMSWSGDGGWWAFYLGGSAINREMPMYFQMNTLENPHRLLDPAVYLFQQADVTVDPAVGEAMMAVYGRFTIPAAKLQACADAGTPDYQCAHNYFVMSHDQVARWIPHVVEFLTRVGL